MSQVIEEIDLNVPVSVAYNQWTQFESFPHFLTFVQSVDQISDTRTHWKVKIAGVAREFDAEITEQHPDERVAWKSLGGDVQHAGVVTFHRLSQMSSRATVQLDWEADGVVEKAGALFGLDRASVKSDLKHFKEFIEAKGNETGAWRGSV